MLKDVKEKTTTGRSFVRTVVLIFEDHAGQILAMGCQNIIGASIKVKDVRDAVKGTLELTVMR